MLHSHEALLAQLAGRGYTITKLDGGDALACDANGGCICLTELHCNGECITLDHNLAVFREALARTEGRTVTCELADTGKLCDTSFFRFEGDIYRLEYRYFDASGRLVGQRNATDYPEYCGGRAMAQFAGSIPDCSDPPRDVRTICSDHEHDHPMPNPLEDLLGFRSK